MTGSGAEAKRKSAVGDGTVETDADGDPMVIPSLLVRNTEHTKMRN